MTGKPPKRGRGRPRLEDGSRKEVVVRLLMSPALRSKLEASAKAEGVRMSEFIRDLIEARVGPA